MKRIHRPGRLFVLSFLLILPGIVVHDQSAALPTSSTVVAPVRQAVKASLLGMPLQFEANHGQVDSRVKFLARGDGYTLFLTPTEAVLVLKQVKVEAQVKGGYSARPGGSALSTQDSALSAQTVIRMHLDGANLQPRTSGLQPLPGIVNYFLGNDSAKWRTNIPTYAKVLHKEVYPGVDVAYYGNQGRLEYDFIVAPGADPNQIKLAFEGADKIEVDPISGDLVLALRSKEQVEAKAQVEGESSRSATRPAKLDTSDPHPELSPQHSALAPPMLRLQKPVVYQLGHNGHKELIAGDYVLASTSSLQPQTSSQANRSAPSTVAIRLASYDATKSLVIDPVLAYSTYLGGTGPDLGQSIALDSAGAVYVTGQANSLNFPTTPGSFQPASGGVEDVFVTKLDTTGAPVYSTYLGGNRGDVGRGIALNSAGEAFVTGYTESTNFPTAGPIQGTFNGATDAFVAKLNATGSGLLYGTYLGGNGDDRGLGIAVDGAGQAVVTGQTNSAATFPTVNPIQDVNGGNNDAFVAKLNVAGSALVYSTYLGGTGDDVGQGIAVDSVGATYVTGYTESADFDITPNAFQLANGGLQNAFVTKLSLNLTGLALDYSTYLGGSVVDQGFGIAVDFLGQAYITGLAISEDFPIVNPFQSLFGGAFDAFVSKLNAAGSALIYSTFLGGTSVEQGFAIAVDNAGQASVTGQTLSSDFPLANPIQAVKGGLEDAFVTKLSPTGSTLVYSTYLGGDMSDVGQGIALDNAGGAFVTGYTLSTNFPTVDPFQAVNHGSNDVFVVKLVEQNMPIANAGPDQTVPEGTPVTLDGSASTGNALSYAWIQTGGPPVTLTGADTVNPTFTAPSVSPAGATLTFQLIVTSGGVASNPATVTIFVTNVNRPPVADAGPDQTVKEKTNPVTLNGTGSSDPDGDPLTFLWTQISGPPVTLTGATTATPTFAAPRVGPVGATIEFTLTVTDPFNASASDSVSIFVTEVIAPKECEEEDEDKEKHGHRHGHEDGDRDKDKHGDKDMRGHGDKDRDKDLDKDKSGYKEMHGDRDRDHDRDHDRCSDKGKDKHGAKDRCKERDDDRNRDKNRCNHGDHGKDQHKERCKERERDEDKDRCKVMEHDDDKHRDKDNDKEKEKAKENENIKKGVKKS